MDVNLPRDKETGKTRGFGFLMYEDQRSTVLAVDNLNGAKVLDRTLRVDHVRQYKQPKEKDADGELIESGEQSLNAKPEMINDDASSESSASSGPAIDPEDPMAAYLLQKRKEDKALKKTKKSKSKGKYKDETLEERKARKQRKKEKRAIKRPKRSAGLKGVEQLLQSWGADHPYSEQRDRARSPPRHSGNRSRSPRPSVDRQADRGANRSPDGRERRYDRRPDGRDRDTLWDHDGRRDSYRQHDNPREHRSVGPRG